MKTIEEIKRIKAQVTDEYRSQLHLEIVDAANVKEGCVMELEAPAVFEDLARLEDKSVRTLGNEFGWKLTGEQAVETIAVHRCMEPGDEWDEVQEAVMAA